MPPPLSSAAWRSSPFLAPARLLLNRALALVGYADQLLTTWGRTAGLNPRPTPDVSISRPNTCRPSHWRTTLVNLGLLRGSPSRPASELGLTCRTDRGTNREPGVGRRLGSAWRPAFQEINGQAELPAIGYGIRYEFGHLRQQIRYRQSGGESTDPGWTQGNPWEVVRRELELPGPRSADNTGDRLRLTTPPVSLAMESRPPTLLAAWSAQARKVLSSIQLLAMVTSAQFGCTAAAALGAGRGWTRVVLQVRAEQVFGPRDS